MTYAMIDVVFCAVILLFTVSATSKGFINEVFGKASFVIAIVIAVIFMPSLDRYVVDTVKQETVSKILSFLIVFVMVFLVIRIVQTILKKIFSGDILRGLDRALGMCLGMAEGVAVVAFVILLFKAQPWFDVEGLLHGSFFVRLLGGIVSSPAQKIHSLAV